MATTEEVFRFYQEGIDDERRRSAAEINRLRAEIAAEINRLRAENERLRLALKNIKWHQEELRRAGGSWSKGKAWYIAYKALRGEGEK